MRLKDQVRRFECIHRKAWSLPRVGVVESQNRYRGVIVVLSWCEAHELNVALSGLIDAADYTVDLRALGLNCDDQ